MYLPSSLLSTQIDRCRVNALRLSNIIAIHFENNSRLIYGTVYDNVILIWFYVEHNRMFRLRALMNNV